MGLGQFIYNSDHQVVVCRQCETCLIPRQASFTNHLRAKPHWLRGDELKATIRLLSGHTLRSVGQLQQQRPDRTSPCKPIAGLATYTGYYCCCADSSDVDCGRYCSQLLAKMHSHVSRHGRKASQHRDDAPLWKQCLM